jgi:branched-chain amino acid transport system permease protein
MAQVGSSIVFIALYGVSFGMVLFTISVGLVVTMGLMRILNLAHGAFAGVGGYISVSLMNVYGVPFPLAVAIAAGSVAVLGAVLERLLYRHLYRAGALDQVLMTIGLAFVAVASLNFVFGPNPVSAQLPPSLAASIDLAGQPIQIYRLAVIALGVALILMLWFVFDRTSFGARLRSAVDNRGMAQAVGINVDRLYSIAFALGCGLAALGGAVGYVILPLDPLYPFKYLTIVLVVVAISGRGKLKTSAGVAILVGVIDTACRYLVPSIGAFVIYVLLIACLAWRSNGLFAARARA